MSVVARKFAASPARIPSTTWETIVNIIAAESDDAKKELNGIAGIAASLIADETPLNDAITVIGSGPRLRIYCLYGEDAIGDEANEASLSWKPFEGEWKIYFPVHEADYDWVTKALKGKNNRFKTYKTGDKIEEEQSEENRSEGLTQLTINTNKLK